MENETQKLINALKVANDINPDEHDASYELVREVVKAYSNLDDLSKCDHNDLDLIYLSTVVNCQYSVEKKKERIESSHLKQSDKYNLNVLLDGLVEKSKNRFYKNVEPGKDWTIGMFGYRHPKSNEQISSGLIPGFIKVCAELISKKEIQGENAILEKVDSVLKHEIFGYQAGNISQILHCLQPSVFPILNKKGRDLYEKLGVELEKPGEAKFYIQNVRRIQKFRDENNFKWKNYRVPDLLITHEEEKNMDEKRLDELVQLVRQSKNVIFTGAPGTGKTFTAVEIADKMGAEYKIVQFHPSYDYTDFVEGLRPVEKNGTLGFERVDGEFKAFCKEARKSTLEGTVDNFDEAIEKLIADLEDSKSKWLDIPMILAKKTFRIALNSYGDGFVTLVKDEDGKYIKHPNNFYNFDQCYNVYKGLPGVHSKSLDNYRKAIVNYMKDKYGLEDYKPGKTEGSEKKPFVFIIDEINRGEVSKIFGETFYAIDVGYRGKTEKTIQTQYQNLVKDADLYKNGFYIPENVYIIGTMNDIDRSVESIDFAFRRRFTWQEITADDSLSMLDNNDAWKDYGEKPDVITIEKLKNRLRNLNKAIENIEGLNSSYHIGASYLLKFATYFKDNELNYKEICEKLWQNHLRVVLFEYLRGRPKASEILDNLKKAWETEAAS